MRLLLVALAIASCGFAIRWAVVYGFSRLLVTYSLSAGNTAAATKAKQLTPKDAEAHLASAAMLSFAGAPDQSAMELERAVALRPADYLPWLNLGLLRDQLGDTAGALKAFDEAVKRAPYYSQPRWLRGNTLLRTGQYEAAFQDLNRAAQSNPELFPALLDLAWGLSKGDVTLAENLAQVNDDQARIAFAKLLARRGKTQESLAQFSRATNVPDDVKRELLDQLLAKGAFKEAHEVWQQLKGTQSQSLNNQAGSLVYDGGFEGSLSFGGGGFGWRVPRDSQTTSISLDSSQPHSGSQSLRIDFSGDSNAIISQLILVEPSRRYRVQFASRSKTLVTAGLPVVRISDAAGDLRILGKSLPLANGTTEWQLLSFEFATPPNTSAVVLSLQREGCSMSECPIFGSVLLDSFTMQALD